MENVLGLLIIGVRRGINLAVRDIGSSDPYVIITSGRQKLKTRVVKRNCNPQWNEDLTLTITDIHAPIKLEVYDKDTFTGDDKMGDAEIDIRPYIASLKMGFQKLPNGCALKRVPPTMSNCLADESSIVWNNGEITQDMLIRLRNVESGEVELRLKWVHIPGCKGLENEGTSRKH
ncbi:hypothetical protein MANES_15G130500v8 [Manihot esculenta]|uniref:Uncharacterized protein n=1 Tax=Manihot esculenta TaxID=3983 RepID=A0ACB7GB49_MANES|nr:hypothetical protein MANES_15G130500v8 [Manihot esculenta]